MSEPQFVVVVAAALAIAVVVPVGWWAWRVYTRNLERWGLAHLPRREVRRELRAAGTGAVPEDPDRRAWAMHVVGDQLARTRRTSRWLIPLGAVLAVGDLILLILDPGLAAALRLSSLVLIVGSQWYAKRRLTQRLAVLSASGPSPADRS